MSNVDWSKAPEGATHYTPKFDDSGIWCAVFWRMVDGDLIEAWRIEDSGELTHVSAPSCTEESWQMVIARPRPWSGEGLPPVGITCKIPDDMAAGNPFLERFEGKTAHIVAHTTNDAGAPLAVFWYEKSDGSRRYHALADNGNFEPIRTPSQIAAEERESFARNLVTEMGKDPEAFPNSVNQALKIYDLCYRKGETK